ncbi:DEAD/DEAH box helicase [Kiritimatiellaeota bacterium B1221]|nr:DEAD/DEAH box helicase [Kiritimatiellaeota bacterium B1221]
MIILHASYADHQLHIWGEKPVDDLEGASKNRGKKTPALFPYDAGEDTLKEILCETLFDRSIRRQEPEMRTVWLPTSGSTAIASSPLLSKNPVAHRDVTFQPWKVTTLTLPLEGTIGFLAAFVGKELLSSGVMGGNDLTFWTRVMRFSGGLVARQEYLPGLEKTAAGEMEALWEPIFLGSDLDYLNELIEAMPHACGCMQKIGAETEMPQLYPATMVKGLITQIVDYLARYSIFTQQQSSWPKSFLEDPGTEFDSMHDHWLNALVTEEPMLPDEKEDLEELFRQVRQWRKPISLSTNTPFRLCLKLEEPPRLKEGQDSANAKWKVVFYLQSYNDPELLIPSEHVWSPTAAEASVLNSDLFDAKEFLLSSLGMASTICPRIEESLHQDAPVGYPLDTDGAYEFLTDRVLALEQAGFGAITPGWWTHQGSKQRLGTKAILKGTNTGKKAKKGTTFSLDHVLEFDWQVTLGGEKVSRKELESLAKSQVPLVQMRGHWIQLGEKEIERAMSLTSSEHKAKASLRDVVQMALGSAKSPEEFKFDGIEASGWVEDFLKQLDGSSTFEELPVPDGFKGDLRPYQLRGYSWLAFLKQWGLGACLADDMGLGKTIQALTLIQQDWENGNRKPYLIICPTSLTGNWQKEAAKFTPDLPTLVHHGVNRNKGAAFKKDAEKYSIIISSYSLLHRDIEILKTIDWAGTILDEAQNIKNPKTKQARSARAIKSEYRVALTGTPIENNVGDLWSIMEFLNQGFLGTQADFKKNFLLPIQANRDVDVIDRLKKLSGPFILRRLKSDKTIIKDLPGKMEMKVYCNLTKEQAALYQNLVNDVETALESTDGIQRKGLVLATLTKLKQICNHPAQYLSEKKNYMERSGKLARLTEMLEEIIEVDERALIFTQFVEMGKIMQQHLQETFGREVIFLHGGSPKKARDQMVERFQEDPNGPHIFVLSLKAGGTGLNLTRANHVFHYDRWWNPAVEDQATDRVYRIGQTKNVQIHKFLCTGTLEERIDEMIDHKKGVADSIVGSDEGWLTELSTDDLRNLFQLQKDAIGE